MDKKQLRQNPPNSYNQSMLNKIAEEQHEADEKVIKFAKNSFSQKKIDVLISGEREVGSGDRSPTPSSTNGDNQMAIEENKYQGTDNLTMLSPKQSHRISKSEIPELTSGKRGRSSMQKHQTSTKEKPKKIKHVDEEIRQINKAYKKHRQSIANDENSQQA